MKLIMRSVIFILIIAGALSCAAGRNAASSKAFVTPLSGEGVAEGSLVYALPLTVIDVTLETERTIEKPGPYARFADDLLGLKDVIMEESEHWRLKNITVKTHEEPDPSQFYVVEASSLFRTNVLQLKKTGIILDVNPGEFGTEAEVSAGANNDLDHLRVFDLGSDEYFRERQDTLYRVVSVDTSFVRIPYLVERKQKLTIDQLAEKAATRLMELRDGKHLILTGETNVFPQHAAPINEMNRLEKEYTGLFTGKTLKESRTFAYHIVPGAAGTSDKVTLCTFSATSGPVNTQDKSGVPLTIDFIPEVKAPQINIIAKKKNESSGKVYDKLYYRVPAIVTVKASFGNESLSSARKLIYQFGQVLQLPANYIIGN
ncbi:MAG: DUF4831 family protein [Bacteroidales bacterium]